MNTYEVIMSNYNDGFVSSYDSPVRRSLRNPNEPLLVLADGYEIFSGRGHFRIEFYNNKTSASGFFGRSSVTRLPVRTFFTCPVEICLLATVEEQPAAQVQE